MPPPARAARPRESRIERAILYLLAMVFLALGIIGVFVPGLPTTVFILMAAWAAARSSPRLHQWLRRHRLFGPMLVNWEAGGYVSRKAKRSASLAMLACMLVMAVFRPPVWAMILAASCMAGVAIWLWQRPEPPAGR
ncbi:YbaN family protein [Corticibacter populi]|nr:YbaN family protein [Corticibacter populi]RZS32059.1 hypothetical protein EV687_2744 [Corticibacter populi]